MLNTNQIYPTNNFGSVKILNYINQYSVQVQFIDTGYTYFSQSKYIKRGHLKDKLAPNVYGVGFIGDGKYNSKCKSYGIWRGIFKRCYCPKTQVRQPTYKDCTVATDWHNFQNFAKWFDENYVEGYDLDKDIKFNGNKLYSAETCLFVSHQENIQKANAKHFIFISPGNNIVEVYNLRKFCLENNLTLSAMHNIYSGKTKHHKGWTHDMELVEMVQ